MTRPPTTLFLTTSYPRHPGDAAGHFVHAHAELERARGREVTVLAFGRPPPLPAPGPSPARTPKVHWLGGAALFGPPGVLPRLEKQPLCAVLAVPALLRAAARLCFGKRPDRVVAHWLFPAAWPLAALFLPQGSELSVIAHGSDVRLSTRLPRFLRRLVWRCLARKSARVRFVSEELRQVAIDSVGADAALTAYIQQQEVEAAPLTMPEVPRRDAARAALGLDADERVLLFVGRLMQGKRPQTALRAASLVPGARVVVLGDGPLRHSLEMEFPEAHFLGDLDRTCCLTWMSAADALLSASRLEGAPTAVREARALGTPVVATEAGDLRQWAEVDAELWLVTVTCKECR